jgi:esterase
MTVKLATTEYGAGTPVAVLHGLFGSARNWATIAKQLGERWRVIAFDLRNHGASPWTATMGYAEMADDVRAAMQARGHRHYALIGHSMGGKTAMIAALADPEAVDRVVVVDIAPIAYPVAFGTYVQAMRGLDLGAIARRREADQLLGRTIGNAAERAFLLQNLVFQAGGPRWQFNLAAIETALPEIASFPAPSGATYGGPMLFIAGGNSRALRPEAAPTIKSLFPDAKIARIAEAGHWVHAEAPQAFLALVESFLAS